MSDTKGVSYSSLKSDVWIDRNFVRTSSGRSLLSVRRHAFFGTLVYSVNLLLVLSLLAMLFGIAWDYSLRRYLSGFADAVTPLEGSPEQKIESILEWMKAPPGRGSGPTAWFLVDREPEETLRYKELLRVCASSTNAFINLATNSGVEARRLLLLNQQGRTKHVVAEVHLGGRWVVVDPVYRTILRNAQGRALSKEELRNAAIFSQATRGIPGYVSNWTYERTAHVRLERLPYLGAFLWKGLDRLFPRWEEAFNWSWVLLRRSITLTILSLFLFCLSLLARLGLNWHDREPSGLTGARTKQARPVSLANVPEPLFGASWRSSVKND